MRIALLEDDQSQVELLAHWLRLAGHQILAFDRSADFLNALKRESFDALLLDWNLPELSGIDVLRELRGRLRLATPVIFATVRNHEDDVVTALKAGADDYLIKPLRRIELLARLEGVTRRGRHTQHEGNVFEIGAFRVNGQSRSITRDNEPLELTAKDFDLAVLLLRNVGRLLTRRHLQQIIWGENAPFLSRTLDTHVSRIRSRLKLSAEHGWRLHATYGYGYRLEQLPVRASGAQDSVAQAA